MGPGPRALALCFYSLDWAVAVAAAVAVAVVAMSVINIEVGGDPLDKETKQIHEEFKNINNKSKQVTEDTLSERPGVAAPKLSPKYPHLPA